MREGDVAECIGERCVRYRVEFSFNYILIFAHVFQIELRWYREIGVRGEEGYDGQRRRLSISSQSGAGVIIPTLHSLVKRQYASSSGMRGYYNRRTKQWRKAVSDIGYGGSWGEEGNVVSLLYERLGNGYIYICGHVILSR